MNSFQQQKKMNNSIINEEVTTSLTFQTDPNTDENSDYYHSLRDLEYINKKIKKFEEKLKEKPVEFKGYSNNHENDPDDQSKKSEMPTHLKKTLYQAVCNGNIAEVEELLVMPSADINMTWVNYLLSFVKLKYFSNLN